MATKVCSKCIIEKDISCFYKRGEGYRAQCKDCVSKSNEQYRNVVENKEHSKEYQKQYRYDHKENSKEYRRQYWIENKEELKEDKKSYYVNNKEAIKQHNKEYKKNRRRNDPLFKLRHKVSLSIYKSLFNIGSSKNNNSILEYLSYTIQELKDHLEKQFESWMTWDNWGSYNSETWDDNNQATWTWNIDHIIPHSIFNYQSMKDQSFKDCWALSNLRPYSSKQNIIDGAHRSKHKGSKK
jgi:hypothetical protein